MSEIKVGDYVFASVRPHIYRRIRCCKVVATRKRFFLPQYLLQYTTVWRDLDNFRETRQEWKYGFQITLKGELK